MLSKFNRSTINLAQPELFSPYFMNVICQSALPKTIVSIMNEGELFDLEYCFTEVLKDFNYDDTSVISYQDLFDLTKVIFNDRGAVFISECGPHLSRRYAFGVNERMFLYKADFLFLCKKVLIKSLPNIINRYFYPRCEEYKNWIEKNFSTKGFLFSVPIYETCNYDTYMRIQNKMLNILSWHHLQILQSMLIITRAYLKDSKDITYLGPSICGGFSYAVLFDLCVNEILPNDVEKISCFNFIMFLKHFYCFRYLGRRMTHIMNTDENYIALFELTKMCEKINTCQKYLMLEMFAKERVTINSHNFGKKGIGADIKKHILSFNIGDTYADKAIINEFAFTKEEKEFVI